MGKDDVVAEVMAFGRCFRNKGGVSRTNMPVLFFPIMKRSEESDPVLAHVALAHKHAVEAVRTEVADALESILEDLVRTPLPPSVVARPH